MKLVDQQPELPDEEAPRAKVRASRWNVSIVWIVPLVAAIVAGYLVYDRVRAAGPEITIRFRDASGLTIEQTPILYRGVQIGRVTGIDLSKDRQHALVTARLRRSAEPIAREGSVFWIVRPELGIGNITGLSTVITGMRIEVLPGSGKPKSEFAGLEDPPVAMERRGLKIVLVSNHLGSLKSGSPVFYRGVEVGAVQGSRLGSDAANVRIDVVIRQPYVNLVRKGSQFWDVSGIEMKAGLFRGLEINMESLRSLMAGGIAFATPEDPKGEPAKGGTVFLLHDKPNKEWLAWAPRIAISPDAR